MKSLTKPSLLVITVAAAGIAAAGFAVWSPSATADPGTDPGTESVIDHRDFSVERSMTSADLISGLDGALHNADVAEVVNGANRTGRACDAPVSHRSASFCWNSGDAAVKYWMPQGVTTSADASSGGTVDGKRVLLSSWYDNGSGGADRGARISFVDLSNPTAPEYRHVLLAEPTGTAGSPSFNEVYTHAGGLAWFGDYLYVTDTFNGFRVFDMKHLLEVDNFDSGNMGRQSDGSYAARGYRYVLPQVAEYTPTTTGGVGELRFSQVGLDRTSSAPALVVSEYNYPGDGARIARFNLDSNGWIATDDGTTDGYADWAWQVDIRSMQGAVAAHGKYYIGRSNGDSSKADLFTWTPGELADEHGSVLPIGTEDMSYWESRDQLWSQSEYPGKRFVYASKLSAW